MTPTRRALLGSAALGVVGALAGCSGASGPEAESVQPQTRGAETDPTVVKPRNPTGESVLLDGSEANDENEPNRIGRELVTSAERADELLVAEAVSDADRERVRSFLDETDYDAETVYVSPAGVRSCERLVIHSVSWQPGRVEYEYCSELRPPDEACEADARVALALLFRLPAALDDRLTGSGSSGHSPCRTTDTEYDVIDGNATVPGNDTALSGADDDGGDGT
ncbi:hypothetical protein C463_06922 [Halorubrum californiense DSM 19288]|uniref:Lipoprotein n=1 Tax=Halorubrum californiense DSM 19288 TaxID=1227465 RepID=M0EA47_9EURY|nr:MULTISPECIES: hypothetical protein [Halorubrum]ELZ44671.1 hypothetical protein C463_06922 [Halorubrum californiense DSM 19288]TKX71632.1 hypothetical protein EXE40_07445 [Halorubrum sp. GN11GM_10-3_MGM]